MTKTFVAKPHEIERKWWLVDAENLILGRASTIIANVLRGKNKPIFTPNTDCGDYVVVINADKIKLTGKKLADKTYYWHTGHPGGIKSRKAGQVLEGKFPERVIKESVTRMITRNPLGRDVLRKLYVYSGAEHPHQGQNPQKLDIAALNRKNSKS